MTTPKSEFSSPELRFLGGVVAVLVMLGIWVCSGVNTDPDMVQRRTVPSKDGTSVMVSRNGGPVHFCTSYEDYDRASDLAAAGDLLGIEQMLNDGRILRTPNRTTCIIIDKGIMSHEVRIMSGPHRGKSGFLAAERVQ